MNSLMLGELESYCKEIFDLESKIIDRDYKIAMLEFELQMEKQMASCIKDLGCLCQKSI